MDATYWRDRITTELSTLEQDEFLIVSEPEPDTAPPAAEGLWARMKAKVRTPVVPVRFGQVLCLDKVLFAEFVGTDHIGGIWPATEDQHEAMRTAGWHIPGEVDPIAPGPAIPHYWRPVPQSDPELVARLLIDAHTILGTDFATLSLTRDR